MVPQAMGCDAPTHAIVKSADTLEHADEKVE
jgi:hypothetical protein